ncbi:MAG: ABC transporter substrate-binding protein [Rhodospirillales bacterium]|nr:ABC transporter substrate-binding protein [Rhodospirillales bacterium]
MPTSTNHDDLRALAVTRGLNRREFMNAAAASGLTVAAASTLWSEVAVAEPMHGGHVTIGCDGGAAVDSFDPLKAQGADHITQAAFCRFDTLTEPGPDGSPMGSLAESWDVSDDGATWTFKLREAEFHNGKTVTAADVVYSLNLHRSEDNLFAEGKNIIGALGEIRADGPDTVVMVQNEVNFDLPTHLTAFGLLIGPEGTTDWETAPGTGPYALEEFEPGINFIGAKYANFYRDDQGYFDSVEILNIDDPASRSSALLGGSADVIGQPDARTAGLLGQTSGYSLLEVPGTQHYTTAMRTDLDPLTDNNLRLAVKYGIKRQEIVDKIFGGYGYVGNDHPIGRNTQFFNTDLPQREYDPEKAAYHLKQAGFDSIDLTLSASDGAFAGSVDMSVLMAESMKEAGINVTVDRAPGDGYWSEVWRVAPWCCVYWSGRPTVDWMLTSTYVSSSSWNDTYFKNEHFDSVLAAARGEPDETLRREMYFELQEILNMDGGTTVVAFASSLIGASDRLAHGAVGGTRRLDDSRLARRWWAADGEA